MKKIGKFILWALGITAWFFLLMMFWMADMTHGTSSHLLILIITGICLAIYIFKKTGSGTKDLEKENQELRAENQKLRRELEAQKVVTDVIDKAENREER